MKIDTNRIIESNRIEAEKILEACKSCPHCGDNCLELDNQCPDQYK